jgi:thiol:disulfide interchange protein DsbD
VAVFLTIGFAWYTHRPAPLPQEATWKEVEAQAKQGGYRLITTAELAELYRRSDDTLLIVDTRQDWEYRTGYIKGAVNFSLEPTWWSAWRSQRKLARLLGPDKVYRDPLGYPEWEKQGLPVERAPSGLCEASAAPRVPGPLGGVALIWALGGIFLGGMALNLTPCVYPLLPITVSYFGGAGGQSRGRLIIHGLLYILGLALTNSFLGVAAALTGGLMGAALQSPIVIFTVAGVLVAFALSLFGFWEIRLPGVVTRAASRSYAGYFGSFFMGLTLGLVAAPCIGPFVLGLLTWVASKGSAWFGFLVFFTLSLGLGVPLFVLALFSGSLDRLPRSGEWLLWVRQAMGWVLLGLAVYFLRPLLPESWAVGLMAAVALAAALHLGWLDRSAATFRAFAWLKTGAGILGLVVAAWLISAFAFRGPGVSWQPYSAELLQTARKQHKPVIIDFCADWCTPCRELEDITFHHADVVRVAKRDFLMLKVDVTRKGDPRHLALLKRYDVRGVPTVVFLDGNGNDCPDLRLVDFVPPEQLLSRMAAMKQRRGN